jgi:hypothetical protein
MSIFPISKILKHQHHWGVFLQHHPRQRNHKIIFLTSLMGCVQSFEVFQPNVFRHSITPTSLPKWPNPS